jgi:hypothetical protein
VQQTLCRSRSIIGQARDDFNNKRKPYTVASLAVSPIRSLLEDRLAEAKSKPSFIQINTAVLLQRRKFISDIQLMAYLWCHALTSSRQCIGQDSAVWSQGISIAEWSAMLECSEKQAFNILKDAADRGVILRKEFRGRGTCYRPCTPEDLATVPLSVPAERKPPPPPDDEEPDADDDEEQDLAGAVQLRPFTIAARRKTKKMDLETAVSAIRYDNVSGVPLSFSGHALKGVLLLRVDAQESEGKAKTHSNRLHGSASDPRGEKGEEKGKTHSNRLHPSVTDTSAIRQDLRDALDAAFFEPHAFGSVEDPLWEKIAAAAGPALPVEAVLNLFRQKIAIFSRDKKSVSPAIAVSWVRFARSRWEHTERTAARKPTTAQESNIRPEERIALLSYTLETLTDYPDDDAARSVIETASPAELAAARKQMRRPQVHA